MQFLPGATEFLTGCNYWSSESGLQMWRDWSETAVEKDFAAMRAAGMNTIRVFPLWSDFQPVNWACRAGGAHVEFVMPDGSSLAEHGLSHWGLSEAMMKRFRQVADLAQEHGLKLIVGLLTGWMSGALFVPPALTDKNLYTHPDALYLETLFLRGFVTEMKEHPAIIAWEPGNECNCLSECTDPIVSWNWLNLIVSTIRLADPSRPVYSGMHGSSADAQSCWNQRILGELTDALTTHPYPVFTPHCGKSALNTIPAVYHAIAETLYYQACGKPAFVEEIGSLGLEYLEDKRAEAYLRTVLYSAYAHGLGGVLWWCAFAFDKCADQLPYRWVAMERNLGALSATRVPYGAARAMKRFQQELRDMPFDRLPPRRVDCLIVLTQADKQLIWKTAYGSFILSTQAGFEVDFCDIGSRDRLPEAQFYLAPSISGFNVMPLHKYRQLLQAASSGATVCFTAGSGMLQPFGSEFGCRVDYRAQVPEKLVFSINGSKETFEVESPVTRRLLADTCDVLGKDTGGHPILIRRRYGNGQLVYLNAPLEQAAITSECKLYRIYRKLAQLAGVKCPEKAPEIGITHHPLPDGGEVRILINYADYEAGGMAPNEVKIETVENKTRR
ncbi:MAG: cellulase family glycosylhydrolase [Victivallales bacterium]|nr:cellulase family glycosylhydrolase [Victivallales bacterium]